MKSTNLSTSKINVCDFTTLAFLISNFKNIISIHLKIRDFKPLFHDLSVSQFSQQSDVPQVCVSVRLFASGVKTTAQSHDHSIGPTSRQCNVDDGQKRYTVQIHKIMIMVYNGNCHIFEYLSTLNILLRPLIFGIYRSLCTHDICTSIARGRSTKY